MLRLLALILVLANGVYYAWSQNALRAWGLERPTQNEPQRLAHQMNPEALKLLSAEDARRIIAATPPPPPPTAAPVASVCLQAGLFSETEAAALRGRLEAVLPAGSWSFQPGGTPGRWIVYWAATHGRPAAAQARRTAGPCMSPSTRPALRRWSRACRWAASPPRPRPPPVWPRCRSAACAPHGWSNSARRCKARCCACRQSTTPCAGPADAEPGFRKPCAAGLCLTAPVKRRPREPSCGSVHPLAVNRPGAS